MGNFSSKNFGFTPFMSEMRAILKPELPYLYSKLLEVCALFGYSHISGYIKLSLGFTSFMDDRAIEKGGQGLLEVGINQNTFFTHSLIEQSNDDQRSAKRALICAANPHNITPIYPQLMEFIGVIEAALKPDPGTNCTLYAFLMDYIKDVFLGQIRVDNGDAYSASVSLDSWKAIRLGY